LQDNTTEKVLILFLQEIKRDMIFRHAHQKELQPQIQTDLLAVAIQL
jgi:hypothetical protein